jgi:hypothetical protein
MNSRVHLFLMIFIAITLTTSAHTNCLIVLLNNSESLMDSVATGHPALRGRALYRHFLSTQAVFKPSKTPLAALGCRQERGAL